MAEVTFTDDNFKKEVLESDIPVVVDFWAEWCMPCRVVSPIIEELSGEYGGKVKVGKLNVDQNPHMAQHYGVMSIPSVLFFKKGEVIKTMIGAQNKENYRKAIEDSLA